MRVNVVSPGPVRTPLYGKLGLDAAALDEVAAQIQGQIPLGRFGTPAEVADMCVYLLSDESRFVTGAEFVIDGGLTAR